MSSRPPMPPKLFEDPETALNEAIAALPSYEATTDNIRIVVRAFWLDDQSQPDEHSYCWGYRIRIENHGPNTVQLLERSWEIIDANGHVDRVRGDGVVGEQPILGPGGGFEYTSGASLDTPSGIMRGFFHMVEEPGRRLFDVRIPAFSLDSPYQPSMLH
ncbi:Co2+/Mg2+ efflux protein ApaG [Acetobacter sp.]|uniref:Co2+/Mg2+ efflux protein ApaG n=1 Tax=Acetobacter sp. TaxID=440 RepID=UPI0025BE10E9|nr:Co2+/Mg2+ efflux protein ApaG [Acetobacter sp.]MCH4090198.1 Co2+/Mg2+ efflux protein ApaG [Acetobacter sp.]MCI1298892.1 Co2+/Mg2+ efflux protein ApaG [Acetobacter sp.]MCI1314912.1 Co2+/Mg2+ efflux protein ApaG [Acetobacter sp.]